MRILSKKHILIVDDDIDLLSLLCKFLGKHKLLVSTAKNAAEALSLHQLLAFDLIILDIMLPGKGGLEFLTDLRQNHDHIPVLMLSAKWDSKSRITGLALGADDYLSKPFEVEELLLRISAILKRSSTKDKYASLGDYSVCFLKKELTHKVLGTTITLSETEWQIFAFLFANKGEVVSRERLGQVLSSEINERSIDVQINRLRTKIEVNSKTPKYLKTIRNKGYILWDR